MAGNYSATIATSGGSDSYVITPGTGGSVTVGACAVDTGRQIALSLYDASGAQLASAAGGSYCAWVSANVSAGQTYTVQTLISGGSGLYRSAWAVNGAAVSWSPNGSLTSSGSSKSYSFPTLGSGTVSISTCGPAGAVFALSLADSHGTTLAQSTAPTACQAVSYSVSGRGLYRLEEASVSGTGPWNGSISTQ